MRTHHKVLLLHQEEFGRVGVVGAVWLVDDELFLLCKCIGKSVTCFVCPAAPKAK